MTHPKRRSLIAENMDDDLLGLLVTVFNPEIVEPSRVAKIVGYDETQIHLRFGESKKVVKTEYDPWHIMLRLTQDGWNFFKEPPVEENIKNPNIPDKIEW
jgi:hypothetical protein